VPPSALPPAAAPSVPAAERRSRPRLRGVSHALAAAGALPAAWALVSRAPAGPAAQGAAVYGATLVALFTVSAVYHRVIWPSAVRHLVGRIDHSAIFLLIAGTYTPFCLLLGPGTGHRLLAAVWVAAGAGIALVVAWKGIPKGLRAALYVLLGWFILPVIPALHRALGTPPLLLLGAGGLFYTVGAAVYAARRPDPFPRVFGFHEIFHLLVVAAAACHFLVVRGAVEALGAR
jgi:hemolysin III